MGKASEEGLLIASQSQINRTLIADFVDGFQKVLHMSASIKLYYITPLQLPCQAWRAVVLMCFLVFIVLILFKPSIQEYTILHVCCKILLRDVEGLFSGLQTNRGSIDAVFVNRRCKICKVIHTLSWLWDSHVHRYRCDWNRFETLSCNVSKEYSAQLSPSTKALSALDFTELATSTRNLIKSTMCTMAEYTGYGPVWAVWVKNVFKLPPKNGMDRNKNYSKWPSEVWFSLWFHNFDPSLSGNCFKQTAEKTAEPWACSFE